MAPQIINHLQEDRQGQECQRAAAKINSWFAQLKEQVALWEPKPCPMHQ